MKYHYRKELIYKYKSEFLNAFKELIAISKDHGGDLQIQQTDLVQQPNPVSMPVVIFTSQGKTKETTEAIANEIMKEMLKIDAELVREDTTSHVYRNPK
jgi:hypothetical protein